MNKIDIHRELCNQIHATYKQKNQAYGDSFGRSFQDYGITSAAVRISDKFNRFVNLSKNTDVDTGDEPIIDTLLDLANYCLMTVIELEKQDE